MAFESVNYQCPACGGPLHFASAEQKLVCDYCDSRFEVEEVEALYRERQDKADAKADTAAATSKPRIRRCGAGTGPKRTPDVFPDYSGYAAPASSSRACRIVLHPSAFLSFPPRYHSM